MKRLYMYEVWCPWRKAQFPTVRYTVAENKQEALDVIEHEWQAMVAQECPLQHFTYGRTFQAMKTDALTSEAVTELKTKYRYAGDLDGLATLLNQLPEAT